jgi:hypothetical protein
MTPQERYRKLKEHLSAENPILLEVISEFETLDKIAYRLGVLEPNETYTSSISWWPMISILGTFSAGKSTFINHYLDREIQDSGNQAVDDKFTVICYGGREEPTTLPGLALDADPRFPFYNISEEINKVDPGEGNRVNLYLQLKTLKSPRIKGKILIDSPGFDADSQRNAILRITSHIVEISDLVLVFFDARHPEPGAMRDTLEHLVATTIGHRDANKVLYILNQIDTTAKEDNLEEVIASWQRALSQEGLVSGNFYGIYNEKSAMPVEDNALRERLKGKKNADLARITERMDKVSIERAYRIIKSLEDFANDIKLEQIPLLQQALKSWSKKVLWTDLGILGGLGILSAMFGAKFDLFGSLFSTGSTTVATLVVIFIVAAGVHFKIRDFFAQKTAERWKEKSQSIANAILHNTRWWKPLLNAGRQDWQKKTLYNLDQLSAQSKKYIQKLNDQFLSTADEPTETTSSSTD